MPTSHEQVSCKQLLPKPIRFKDLEDGEYFVHAERVYFKFDYHDSVDTFDLITAEFSRFNPETKVTRLKRVLIQYEVE